MTPAEMKKRLLKGRTPAARSIGKAMPGEGRLRIFKEGMVTWVQVDNGGKRFKSGLPDYNEDSKQFFNQQP